MTKFAKELDINSDLF